MSSTGCNPAASCCGGSTPPVRILAIRERRNACQKTRHSQRPTGSRSRTFGSAVVERECVSAATVEGYRTWLEDGREAPPLRRSSRRPFLVRDGRHRLTAARAAGHTLIEAEVRRRDLASHGSGGAQSPSKLVWPVSPKNISGDEALVAERLVFTEEERFISRRLHSSLRSVNGKHAPFVRPRCGFDSCRRLLPTPVAQWTERCSATAEAAGSTPAGRATRGRSSAGRAPGRHPGEARSIRVVRSR